jgi:hypothetical protein
MTCHSLATIKFQVPQTIPADSNTTLSYTADQYISLTDPIYNGYTQLDFAWSIQGTVFAP